MKKIRNFGDFIGELYYEEMGNKKVRTVTLQVTEDCNLCCTYCYQINKSKKAMTFEMAKQIIDLLLEGTNSYINLNNTQGIILEFFGGEPLLQIDLIEKTTDYFLSEMIKQNHPWLLYSRISICTNGVLYLAEKFQKFLEKYSNWVSISITIDGNEQLHNSCRVFPDGTGSYEIVYKSVKKYLQNKNFRKDTKMTFAPQNISYLFEAIKNLLEIGYDIIYANCIFEEGWNLSHAKIFYYQLKKLSDYILENDLEEKINITLYDEDSFTPLEKSYDKNWCGGNGEMLAVDSEGNFYPCIRYMRSSLGEDAPPIIIGNLNHGLEFTEEEKNNVLQLKSITRSSQSTQECINCKIAKGCSWCSAYNYQYYKTLNKRTTFICDMHKARALANSYFWNKYYIKNNSNITKKIYLDKDEALKIIPEEEFNLLISLSEGEKK